MISHDSCLTAIAVTLVTLFAFNSFIVPIGANVRHGNVVILSHSSYRDDQNQFWIVGEVENSGDSIASSTVTVTFYDSRNNVLTRKSVGIEVGFLLPGGKSPFKVCLTPYNGAQNVSRYSVEVSWTDETLFKPLWLAILSHSKSTDNLGHLHVNGAIKNLGTQTASNVRVIATFYDSSGVVIGVEEDYVSGTHGGGLWAKETSTFDVELANALQVAKVATYSITAVSYGYGLITADEKIMIDGDPSDWTALGLSPNATDPPYNIKSYQMSSSDLLEAWVYGDSKYLYLMIKVRGGNPAKDGFVYYVINFDIDQNRNTGDPSSGYDFEIMISCGLYANLRAWNNTISDWSDEGELEIAAGDLGHMEIRVPLFEINYTGKADISIASISEDEVANRIRISTGGNSGALPSFPSWTLDWRVWSIIITLGATIAVLLLRGRKKFERERRQKDYVPPAPSPDG